MIKHFSVEWYDSFHNTPVPRLLLQDRPLNYNEIVFHHMIVNEGVLYYYNDNGFVSMLLHDPNRKPANNHRGLTIKTEYNKIIHEVYIKDPITPSVDYYNGLFLHYSIMPIHWTTNIEDYLLKRNLRSGFFQIDVLQQCIDKYRLPLVIENNHIYKERFDKRSPMSLSEQIILDLYKGLKNGSIVADSEYLPQYIENYFDKYYTKDWRESCE